MSFRTGPGSAGTTDAGGAAGGRQAPAGPPHRPDGGARLQGQGGGCPPHAHRGRAEEQRNRRREAGRRPGALVGRAPARNRHRRLEAGRPPRRRRRRDDARRDAALRPAADRGAPVRVARLAVSDRAQRHAPDHGRRVARRPHGADAGGVRPGGPRARALRGAGGRPARGGDAPVPRVVQRRRDDRSRC